MLLDLGGPTVVLRLRHFRTVLGWRAKPGDIVVADNLASHKVAGVRQAIEARQASMMFLPSYSPDLIPIEQVFAKLKSLICTAAPQTREALWTGIGAMLDRFSPAECRNYLAHSGYGRSA